MSDNIIQMLWQAIGAVLITFAACYLQYTYATNSLVMGLNQAPIISTPWTGGGGSNKGIGGYINDDRDNYGEEFFGNSNLVLRL